jgi:hypothetical protein
MSFFKYMWISKTKKRVEYTLVMNFEGQSASEAKDLCGFFADFIELTHAENVLYGYRRIWFRNSLLKACLLILFSLGS